MKHLICFDFWAKPYTNLHLRPLDCRSEGRGAVRARIAAIFPSGDCLGHAHVGYQYKSRIELFGALSPMTSCVAFKRVSVSVCRFRVRCQKVITHKMFDHIVLVFIFLNCITIALERPDIQPHSMVN